MYIIKYLRTSEGALEVNVTLIKSVEKKMLLEVLILCWLTMMPELKQKQLEKS